MKNIQLTVTQPCHQSWNNMDETQKGRFCASCRKQVIDFSAMTDSQLAAFFKKPAGSVCGRFHTDQLQKNIALPKKQLPFIKYVFAVVIPAFLLSLKSGAQKIGKLRPPAQENRYLLGEVVAMPFAPVSHQPDVINGIVTDKAGKGIPYATVIAAGTGISTVCDSNGKFILISKEQKVDSITVSCIGYKSKGHAVKDKNVHILLEESSGEILMGFVTINTTVKKKPQKPVPLLARKGDANPLHFSVYPNPVSRNASFKINASQLEKGTYRLTLLNNAGDVFCNKEVIIDKENSTIEINTGNAAPGAALIQLIHTKTGRQTTEKIIVQ